MVYGLVHSIESMGLVDGPGIRTVVFLQGCRMRCLFCHNPDTWPEQSKTARSMTSQELIDKVLRFKPYFGSKGGITFSGGEPLLQPDFLIDCLKQCKDAGINTCIDTSGFGIGRYEEILELTDLVLMDIKHYSREGYIKVTGRQPDEAEKFLKAVQDSGTPMWIRHVVVPGLTDGDKHFEGLEQYLKTLKGIEKVELLPYHTLGVHKYKALGIPYPLEGVEPMDAAKLDKWNERLNKSCVSAAYR